MIQSLNLVEISTLPLQLYHCSVCALKRLFGPHLLHDIFEKVGQFCFDIQERLFVTSLFSSLRSCKDFFFLI